MFDMVLGIGELIASILDMVMHRARARENRRSIRLLRPQLSGRRRS